MCQEEAASRSRGVLPNAGLLISFDFIKNQDSRFHNVLNNLVSKQNQSIYNPRRFCRSRCPSSFPKHRTREFAGEESHEFLT